MLQRAHRSASRPRSRALKAVRPSAAAMRCRRKFLAYFPGGFRDPDYLETERAYKQLAHERWQSLLGPGELRRLLNGADHGEIARRAVTIESRTNLLFSFEKMALRDAVRPAAGARTFAEGLKRWLGAPPDSHAAFERWVKTLEDLPRRQTRVVTWPLLTVFGFIAEPRLHMFLKPNVTRRAAAAYGFEFSYSSRPSFEKYRSLLAFAEQVRRDQRDLRPRDMIDLQSFIWVLGSDEYPD
jgi:hypothetical protein